MSKFIEIETDGKKELINISVIESVFANGNKTNIRLSSYSSTGTTIKTVDNNYEYIKNLLLQ